MGKENRETKPAYSWREEVEDKLIKKPKKRYASWTEELNLDNLALLGPQWWVVRVSRVEATIGFTLFGKETLADVDVSEIVSETTRQITNEGLLDCMPLYCNNIYVSKGGFGPTNYMKDFDECNKFDDRRVPSSSKLLLAFFPLTPGIFPVVMYLVWPT